MDRKTTAAGKKTFSLNVVEPYDFSLTLRAIRSFQPALADKSESLLLTARVEGITTLIEISQEPGAKNDLRVISKPENKAKSLLRIVEWVLFAELDLRPFYRITDKHPKLKPVIRSLYGLKPMRPVSLFEMAVIAITEQQISLAAAYKIRSRIVEKFGESIYSHWIFPEPDKLASASLEDLRSCGLSRQKAEYIQNLAGKTVDGSLDLENLKVMDDESAREMIMDLRGFGRWSADYILIRGLARPDSVPIDDLAIRSVIGEYLADGQRVTAHEASKILEPFRPYRGLLAFYLLANHRLNPITG
jgi:DNA-3-methyladenine glycosylase II